MGRYKGRVGGVLASEVVTRQSLTQKTTADLGGRAATGGGQPVLGLANGRHTPARWTGQQRPIHQRPTGQVQQDQARCSYISWLSVGETADYTRCAVVWRRILRDRLDYNWESSMSINPVVPLEFLGPQERARVVEMDGDSSAVHRLQELGLRVGTIVEVVKSGRPSILRIGEHRLSFRPADQMSVMVEVLETGDCPPV